MGGMPPTTIIRIILNARTKNFISAVYHPESCSGTLNLKNFKRSITAKFCQRGTLHNRSTEKVGQAGIACNLRLEHRNYKVLLAVSSSAEFSNGRCRVAGKRQFRVHSQGPKLASFQFMVLIEASGESAEWAQTAAGQ
jgi:hypothetical protein